MMTAGRRHRARSIALGLAVFVLFMHGLAYVMVGRYAHIGSDAGPGPGKAVLLVITGNALLSAMLMLSQAMESVTRAFYTRADLDLILSSPASARRLFSVRIAAMALSITAMAMLLAAPFIDVLAVGGGPRWLGAYGVVAALGMASTAFAVALTVALFRTLGPRRTRLVAQIVAAVIGAAFVIGLQVAAIFSVGTLSRLAFLQSPTLAALTPDAGSMLWWPARAVLGDLGTLAAVLAAGAALLGGAVLLFAPRFADHALAAAGVAGGAPHRRRCRRGFRRLSPMQALRCKEWALLRRDPWLLSQTLMQLLYLLPPALLLWRSFAAGMGVPALLVPVLVMAAGQFAGGLAWLAISGEDAPDLIASAPVSARAVMRAKIEAVLGAVALVFAPFVAALMLGAPAAGLVAALFIAIVAAASTAIQFWFRSQARRSQFRRRQTSSRVATFAEALSSVLWSATAALAALGTWLAAIPGALALAILAGTRFISPARS
jgi:ABC-2 type transport system permease protein